MGRPGSMDHPLYGSVQVTNQKDSLLLGLDLVELLNDLFSAFQHLVRPCPALDPSINMDNV